MSIIVCPNKPDETVCPLCIIDETVKVDDIFDKDDEQDPDLPDPNIERVYNLFSLDWNTANWVNVYQNVSKVAGQPSIYVWRYNEILAPKGTKLSNSLNPARKANQTTDLYSRLTVGNFTSLGTVHVSTELLGLVYATPGGAVSPEDMAMTDHIACGLLGVPME